MKTLSALALIVIPIGFLVASTSAREARLRQMRMEVAPRLREIAGR